MGKELTALNKYTHFVINFNSTLLAADFVIKMSKEICTQTVIICTSLT